MYHCVPDFEKDEDCLIPKSSVLIRPKESAMADQDDVVELLWQNGQVVLQSQTQRTQKRSTPADQSASRENPSHQHQHQDHLFMQEDEMASWLDYPLNDTNFDSDFCADLLYPTPCVTSATIATPPGRKNHVPASCPPTTTTASASKPPIPPPRTENRERTTCTVTETSTPPNSKNLMGRESTVVDSSDTPAERPESRVSKAMRSTEVASRKNNVHRSKTGAGLAITSSAGAGGDGGGGAGARDSTTIEMTVTSSPGGSSASAERSQKPPAEDRKRKGREADDECHSELKDVELESANVKKRIRGSTSTKRSRAAEVHNHSERRRRDRINEKMKALQELVPRCNKLFVHSDKASMLDEAIEYLKSLQLQVQMMSMWCGMVSMMFPGMQQYMPNMGMGVGMGMDMGMNRPMLPFPNLLAGSPLPTPPAAAHLGLRFPMPAVPGPDPSRIQTTNRLDPFNSFGMQNPNQPRLANFVDPCQQYLALHQTQLRLQQNQSMTLPSASKPSSSTGAENPANHPSGT